MATSALLPEADHVDIHCISAQGDATVTRIQKWGNSQGLRISRTLLTDAGLDVGDELDVAVRDGALVLTPVRRTRGGQDLRGLVRRIPRDYRPGELDWGRPKGREVW